MLMDATISRRAIIGAAVLAGASLVSGCAPGGGLARPSPAQRPLGIQLYMLGDIWLRNPAATFAELAAIGFREIEMPQIPSKDRGTIVTAARDAGLAIRSIHLGSGRLAPKGQVSLDSPPSEIADAFGELGAAQAVLSMMPVPAAARLGGGRPFGVAIREAIAAEGGDYWRRLADLLNMRAAELAPLGIALGYHNHDIEFAPVEGTTGYDLLLRHLDPAHVHLELDIGWVTAAGRNPAAMIRALGPRVRQLHLKDVASAVPPQFALDAKPAVVGAGIVDWRDVLAAADEAGVAHAYVEQEPPFEIPRMEAARRSQAYLATLRA
jgi:sugar phosphate isomerase/epimerase